MHVLYYVQFYNLNHDKTIKEKFNLFYITITIAVIKLRSCCCFKTHSGGIIRALKYSKTRICWGLWWKRISHCNSGFRYIWVSSIELNDMDISSIVCYVLAAVVVPSHVEDTSTDNRA